MELTDKAEEILETLWISINEKNQKSVNLDIISSEQDVKEIIDNLIKSDLITISEKQIRLTNTGEEEAEDVVRRHRLAERLLVDVLDVKGRLIHDSACQFEHLLHKGIDENVCILLGHPKTCPHGRNIPIGKCCIQKEKGTQIRLVSPLSGMVSGQKGKIAYIQASDQKKLQKMMAMGVLPGQIITLLQSFPSYLFKVGNSEFAVDKQIADEIYVRIAN